MLRKSRETFFNDLGRDAKENPKRLWSVLKRTSKTRNIPDTISSANNINTSGANTMQRTVADNPYSIANIFVTSGQLLQMQNTENIITRQTFVMG